MAGSQRLGLHKVVPADDAAHTSVDIIAIHGLATESPGTWVFKRKDGREVNWLADPDMLPAAMPEARIFTYDWNANHFKDAPVQTLLGHADGLLALMHENWSSEKRPIIFVASCFGGLVVAEALTRAAQEGSRYRQVLLSTVGIVFLATPFHGTDVHQQARWQVVVGGIMGEDTSDQLVHDLDQSHDFISQRVQKFVEVANADSIRLPVHCFFETKKTEILKRVLPSGWAARLSAHSTHQILVSQSSACLHGFPRHGLNATHSSMNKFDSPESPDFRLVKDAIKGFAEKASSVLRRRTPGQSSHWIVPFGRNEGFIGRDSILNRLLERIPPSANDGDCQHTAIEGHGGVGKTQIALEAAFRLRDKHPDCSVFWVPAIDINSFENAYREIGREMKVQGINEDKADVKTLVKAVLSGENAGRWLLIVDNADDTDLLFGPTGLCDYLPFSRMGSILFTTRNHEAVVRLDIPAQGIITTTEMSRTEAIELLQRSLKESQTRDIASITSLLDFLANMPLAIKQASAYIAKTEISTTRYLEHCQSSDKNMIKLLSKDFEDRGHYGAIENPVATTWLISFERISRDNPLAAQYLRFMSFLAEKDIPVALLPPINDELEVDEAIGVLKAYAFITQRKEQDSFDMHRLVRLAMRNWLNEKSEQMEQATKVIRQVTEIFHSPRYETRDVWIKYLPHAQAALNFREDCTDEKAELNLLLSVSSSFCILGKYREAEPMHQQIFELGEKMLTKEHPGALEIMNNVAELLRHRGKYKEAEQMHRQIFKLMEKMLGKEHPNTLASMNNIALVLSNQGRFEEAGQMHRQTLELREKALGEEHPDILASKNNIALVLSHHGKYEKAEQMHRKVLEVREKMLGKEHPDTLSSMNNIALVLFNQRKFEEAEQMHRQTLELQEKVLGKEDPRTLDSMNNIALVLFHHGEYKEAEKMHRQVLELRENMLGKEHPSTLDSMNNVAVVLSSQGKFEEAEQMHRQTLELREKALGKEHPETLASKNNLGLVLSHYGKYKEAEQMHRQVLELREKMLGKEHPSTLSSMNNVAAVLFSQGKLEEAEQMHRQTLELREKALGKEHPETLASKSNLALVFQNQGK